MSKHAEADLILKLYDLRREAKLRDARDWYTRDFFPDSFEDFQNAMFTHEGAYLRMVTSYWEMAAALVNHGAIPADLFTETNGEAIGVFSKLEPILEGVRGWFGPLYMANLEKYVDSVPDGRQRSARTREMMKGMRERIESTPTSPKSATTKRDV